MTKKEARQVYRTKRASLSVGDQMKRDDLLLIQLQTLQLPELSHVLSFYPVKDNGEVDSLPITDFLHFRNLSLTISYPRIASASGEMQAVKTGTDTIFEGNRYNIPEPVNGEIVEPEQIDLVLLPLLAFDEQGNRAGYGKGYYDRFLVRCRPDCIKLGLSYFEAIDSLDDADDYDVPLDLCITPERIYVF